ncbi:MAG: 1-acyl-sn-glycerol-3-phosphate acyltransferase [Bacteroidales bacterium]|jgi:1-acyl-sn-glycerol-3-phosphate acyltransferase|nr:1-acyl-sn-glycerol-3-phosphate acyltransferase [Bacteroidales bacterium]
MSKSKIYKYSFAYYLLSRIAFLFMRIYYRKIHIRGQENVPTDKPVIFAPNHKNGLMDPLLILFSFPHDQIVFMAVSYFFAVNKTFSTFLRFLKMLPVYRARENVADLDKNRDPFIEAIETLEQNKKLCLMPEGRQIEIRKLLPLVKGMFRIALFAQEKFGVSDGVKIIPVGIEYEDLNSSGRNVTIQFGKPLEMSDYFELYLENPAKAYNTIRADLYPRISELMLNVNSANHYESIYLATILQTDDYIIENKLADNVWNRLKAKQEICRNYLDEEKNNPEKLNILDAEMGRLLSSGKSSDKICRLLKKSQTIDVLKIILLLPFFIPGATVMLLPYFIIKFSARKMANKGFYSSLSFVMGIFIPALFFILYFFIFRFFMSALVSALISFVVIPILSIIAFKLKNLYFDTIQRFFFRRKYQIKTQELFHFF